MRERWPQSGVDGVPTVIHLLPVDLPRGAQAYARSLVDHLDSPDERHLVATIFRSGPGGVALPDIELDINPGFGRKVGFEPVAVRRLRALIRHIQPGVIVAHGGESAKYAAASIDADQPMVYLMIGSFHHRLSNPVRRWLHSRYVHRANIVVAVSDFLAREAIETHGIPSERVVVIPNGRDAERFRFRQREGSGFGVRVVFVGDLNESKRPDVFLDVVEEVRARGVDLEAQVIGDGPMAAVLRSRADEYTALLGARTDVPELLANADVLVFPGRPPEGMPGVLIEAGLSGIPVLTTDVPGAAEVVIDGETGFVVAVDDLTGLADRLVRLASDSVLRTEMGQAARDRCVRLFSQAATEDAWRRVLGEVAVK